jgi:hypothetical protein
MMLMAGPSVLACQLPGWSVMCHDHIPAAKYPAVHDASKYPDNKYSMSLLLSSKAIAAPTDHPVRHY